MTWLPVCLALMARRAAAVIRSAVATLLPPNFCTINGKGSPCSHPFALSGNKEMIVLSTKLFESFSATSYFSRSRKVKELTMLAGG